MKIELLYPAIASLYGEQGNLRLLKQALKEAQFIETELNQVPAFVHEAVDLIYMGPMSEDAQLKIIEWLRPHTGRLRSLIDGGTHFLITGNALDIFGESITDEQGLRHEALGLFPFTTREDKMHRFNGLVHGQWQGLDLVGFKSQFAMITPTGTLPTWMKVIRGTGFNKGLDEEGILDHHFYGTHCIGPILVMNPLFTLKLLEELGIKDPVLPHQEALMEAYRQRLSEFEDPKIIDWP